MKEGGGAIAFGDGDIYSINSDCLLNLSGTNYEVEVELKGEDPEKSTVTKKKTFNLSLTKSTEAKQSNKS